MSRPVSVQEADPTFLDTLEGNQMDQEELSTEQVFEEISKSEKLKEVVTKSISSNLSGYIEILEFTVLVDILRGTKEIRLKVTK